MEPNTENENSLNNEESTAEGAATETEQVDVEALKAEAAKAKELEVANRQLFERAKKAEGFVKMDGKWVKAPKQPDIAESDANTGDLDETQLDYLDLKGINEEEDISIIQSVMKRTGQSLRQALKDDYVVQKLEANKQERAVKAATPSATRRSGQVETNDVEIWLEKNARTGELPSDFALRAKVVEAKIARAGGTSTPPWRR